MVCKGDKFFYKKKRMFNLADSPRLTGGGSPSEERYLADSNDLQNVEMCCRGPAVVKPLLSRGTCPAELENKFATYGNSTKQLVSFKMCLRKTQSSLQ